MVTYVILSQHSPDAFREPGQFREIAAKVAAEIKLKCPGINWQASYSTLGRFDAVDIIEGDDPAEITRAATIIRGYGMSSTESMPAIPWQEFLDTLP